MIRLDDLVHFLNELLHVGTQKEKAGLAIRAAAEVYKVGAAVDLSLQVIAEASRLNCDFLFTHHAAWPSTDADLAQVKTALIKEKRLSLYTCHEPLDTHPEIGRAISLVDILGWEAIQSFCDDLGVLARPPSQANLADLERTVSDKLRTSLSVLRGGNSIGLVGVIAG
jgi:putative NIF3 family GTP cyclohydrolase 1 type 2